MLHLYNSLSGQIEKFTPLDPAGKKVTMYNCGPTVYDYGHIGNFRSFLLADLIRRVLELNNFEVKQVMNITDVGHMTDDEGLEDGGEDKMVKALKKKGKFDDATPVFKNPYDVANFYTKIFLEDMETLNFQMPHVFPKATEHIDEMVEIIQDLMKKGVAYKSDDGTIYYDITKFPNYGKLSNNTVEKLISGAGQRVDENVIESKRNPVDFSLWKLDEKHIMKWDTPIGTGYPGWHIECSAMIYKHLGEQIDIHTGGEDNKFPHHECEIAQTESFTNKKFVNYWLHAKHLQVDSMKMSKSKGNFYTIRDLTEKGFHPLAIRMALMSAHFMKSLNFTLDGVKTAHNNIEKLVATKNRFESNTNPGEATASFTEKVDHYKKEFLTALNDNLKYNRALGEVFKFINELPKDEEMTQADAKNALELFKYFDSILGVIFDYQELEKELAMPESEIEKLVKQRNEAKANKDWGKADEIRDQLKAVGIVIVDSKDGTTWKQA